MELISLLFCTFTILCLLNYFIGRKYSYWSDRGVVSAKPQFPLGNLGGSGFSTTFGEKTRDLYTLFKGKGAFGGLYFFLSPVVLVTDLDFLRSVFVTDFEHFHSRGSYVNEDGDPLTAHLANLEGEKWRKMRKKLTPTFTSGKMKLMHSTFQRVSDQFNEHLHRVLGVRGDAEVKALFEQFTTDIIGNVAFGLECNSMKDQNCDFLKYSRKVFHLTPLQFFKNRLFIMTFPRLAKALNIPVFKKDLSHFFLSTIRQTINHREENNFQRNDFLELLMQIKRTGKLDGDTVEVGKLSFEQLAAQMFVFFVAGFETSSSTMTFAAYELALNQKIQQRARDEIKAVLKRHDGVMSYEAAMEMTYLDQVIKETLRKYPIIPTLRRKVSKTYKVPGTDVVLEKGTGLMVPVFGIHHDPEIYPEPEIFDPQRFTKENVQKRHPHAWLPFGEGHRICIGQRFGMMQTRMGLATLLNSFNVRPSEKTPNTMKFQPSSSVLSPVGGMWLHFENLL